MNIVLVINMTNKKIINLTRRLSELEQMGSENSDEARKIRRKLRELKIDKK